MGQNCVVLSISVPCLLPNIGGSKREELGPKQAWLCLYRTTDKSISGTGLIVLSAATALVGLIAALEMKKPRGKVLCDLEP